MQHPSIPAIMLALAALVLTPIQAQQGKSGLASEPGTIQIEGVLPKPIKLTVLAESIIYYQSDLQRALGGMAPGTTVQLLAINDIAWKVRGRARHGDVAGWMRIADLKSPDPKLVEKLKAYCERKRIVEELIQKHQIAVGLTVEEVKASLGHPARKSSRVTATGREETYEYSIYKSVPQAVTGRDQSGNLVQNIIYVKVETGRLTVSFREGSVTEIQETQGNTPIPGGEVKIVPGPIVVF
ncbi:MAG: hypothetical protein K8R87_10870 [Verrucomicrobia bacterium]|nr:hypothetical protein [Verrucomicrobiota bacterium]